MADRDLIAQVAEMHRRSRALREQSVLRIVRSHELIAQSRRPDDLNELIAEFRREVAAARAELARSAHLN